MANESLEEINNEELLAKVQPKELHPLTVYKNEFSGDVIPKIPLQISLGLNAEQPYFRPFEHQEILKKSQETPSFVSTLFHEFSESNEIFEGARAISGLAEHLNALTDEVPKDWTPYEVENLNGIDKRYWSYIFDSLSPKELDSRRAYILERQTETESYNNGSFLAKLLGGGAGYIMGPSSLAFGLLPSLRYASASQQVMMNVARAAPDLALQSVTHNAWMESNKVGGNLEEFVLNSIVDTTAGLALVGSAAGLSGVVSGSQLYNARKAMALSYKGIEIKFKVNEKGALDPFDPYVATPMPGFNLSAAEVNSAQEFLNSQMAKEGLFKLIPGLTKASGYLSPVVRMLSSEFSTVSEFANRLFDHSIITKGLAAGKTAANNFERVMWGVFNSSKRLGWELEGIRKEANGIETGGALEKSEKTLMQRMSKGDAYDKEGFGAAVANVIRTGEAHENKAINSAADLVQKHLLTTYQSFLKAYGLSEEVFPPRTAIGYLMRNYNVDAVNVNKDTWVDVISNELKRQDELIFELKEPLGIAQTRLNQLKAFKLGATTEDKALINEINQAQRNLNEAKIQYNQRIQDDADLHILLEERNFLDSKQRDELKNILKPQQDAHAKVVKQKELVAAGKKELARLKSLGLKAKKAQTKLKHTESLKKTKDNIKVQEEKLRLLENELQALKFNLENKAHNGEINSRLFLKNSESGEINFRNPDELPVLRAPYESHEARITAALAYRDTITNMTPESLGRQMLGTLSGGSLENPLNKRSLMIPDYVLQNNGFLSNDLSRNIMLYDMVLGKKTAFKRIFDQFGIGDGLEGITKELNREFKFKEALIEKLPEEKRAEARRKLKKTFDKNFADVKTAYDYAMGNNSRSRKVRIASKAIRDFTVSTRLGSVPLTMITDIGGIFLNNSFIEVIRDGIGPFIRTFNGLVKSKEGIAFRENASHLFIANEHLSNAYAEKAWNSSTMADVSVGGKIANGLEKIANLSGNIFGTNYMDNWAQRLAANMTQSKIMNYLFKYKKGTISKKETLVLNKLGINPEEWADRFIAGFKEVEGESVTGGGYQSQYYLWSDEEAALRMGNAIRSGVRASVLKKGLGDAPFWTNDPAWGLVTHLKGWLFSAFTRYTVPTMQRLDVEKVLGFGVMLMMGSLVDPLRKWSRGEEYDFSNKSKFALDALNNSGAFGILTDVIQDLNALLPEAGKMVDSATGSDFFSNLRNDRYRDRTWTGIIGGPLGGIADNIVNVANSFLSGKITEQSVKQAFSLIPLSQPWYTRGLSNKLIEGLELPKHKSETHGWFEQG